MLLKEEQCIDLQILRPPSYSPLEIWLPNGESYSDKISKGLNSAYNEFLIIIGLNKNFSSLH